MNNITMSAASHRRAMNGNQQIRIELHQAFISKVYPSVGGAQVRYTGAPGHITEFEYVSDARNFVADHNARGKELVNAMDPQEVIDYAAQIFGPIEQQAAA